MVTSPAENDLDALKRKPSDLLRYIAWSTETKAQYGSILNFICQRRLHWHLPDDIATPTGNAATTAICSNPVPFADPEDYKILRNDWPYGVAPGISHLVVWLRTPLATRDGGYLTEESHALVDAFIQRTFVAPLEERNRAAGVAGAAGAADPKKQVLWFKNWGALQSIRSLEHVHVLVRDVPEDILKEWMGET